jgi:hypothetical protein
MVGIAVKHTCPSCGGEGHFILYQEARGKHIECRRCGHLFSEDGVVWRNTGELDPERRAAIAADLIAEDGWFHFGREQFECPSLDEERVAHFVKTGRLSPPCDHCYKGLMFWTTKPASQDFVSFFRMYDTFAFPYRGKVDNSVAVFYFREKPEVDEFLTRLDKALTESGVHGRVQWRRACKAYQTQAPQHWINAKTLKHDG